MDEVRGPSGAMERDAAAYADLLAGFSGFTLQRWLTTIQGSIDALPATIPLKSSLDALQGPPRKEDVYESHDAAEVAELRGLLAARATGDLCRCGSSASISLEGGPAAVLSLHHGVRIRRTAPGEATSSSSAAVSSPNGWPPAACQTSSTR